MKLLSLKLKNFKGIRSFELYAGGENIAVFGDNATGKTTLFDSFVWLLFDKDSQNKKDFDIKTLDKNNQPIHNLEHEVEGTFEVDGKTLTLRKVYSEQWTKKRGSINTEFTGHTTDYFINGVPVQKKEYTAKIDEIAREDIFKLLTSPTYFNSQLSWQDRRKILLEICGDVSDADVIASNSALKDLPAILQGYSLDDLRKIIAARRAKINDELKQLPIRIDETERGLPDTTSLNLAQLQKELELANAKLNEKQQEITRIQNGSEITEKRLKLREIETEILRLEGEWQKEINSQTQGKQEEANSINSVIAGLRGGISTDTQTLNWNRNQISNLERKMNEKRAEWQALNAKELVFHQAEVCPTCGQAIPKEQLEEAKQKALEVFNLKKATELEQITKEGQGYKAEVERLRAESEALEKQIAASQQQVNEYETRLANIQSEIRAIKSQPYNSVEYQAKLAEKKTLQEVIDLLQSNSQESINAVKKEIETINITIGSIRGDIAKFDQCDRDFARIEELKQQEKRLAQEYEGLEKELYLTEEFIRSKVNLLEEKINSRFKMAKFKLFETQINGGLAECCETLYEGVPYNSNLNNGAKINVGLDIINVLSEHYNFVAPIFIDNAESVTELIETWGQKITLVVSKPDKKLRVEYQEKAMKEAV